MHPISEVLRLAAQQRSQREISISTGLAKTTVNRYLRRAEAAGLSWPLPADLDESALEGRLFRAGELRGEPKAGRPEPDWEAVHRELKSRRHHVTIQLLWMEYRERHPEGWGYTQFCVHYREWLGRQDPVMRLPHVAGEKMYVDFCGDTVAVIGDTRAPARSGRRRCSWRCWGPAATSTPRRCGVRTRRAGWTCTCARSSSTAACPRW